MKRFKITFQGLVQGVGFRWLLTNIANKYNVSGFCQNLDNGDVYCEIQGNSDNLDAFINDILAYKGYIRIDNYTINSIDQVKDDYSFIVKY